MSKSVFKKFALLLKAAVLSALAVGAVSCADYTDINKEKADYKAAYYAYESALLEPETLKEYIDLGHRTPDGRKVVIINVDGAIPANVIRGALPMPQNDYFTESRSDGPLVVGNMVASGAKMDAALRFAGIDGNTLIVITGANLTTNNIHRVWWTFSYWGFSNKYVKILNGANQYFASAYPEYMETPAAINVTPSTFSVKDLPGNNIDAVRAPLGEVIDDVKAGAYVADGSGVKILIPTMPASTPVMNGSAEVTKIANAGVIGGRIRGGTQLNVANNSPTQYVAENGKYKTPEEIAAAITTFGDVHFLPADKMKRIIVHCGAGQSTSPHFFVIKEILGYANTAIYDGSWNEWGNLAMFIPSSAAETFARGTGAVQSSYLTWDFSINNYIDSLTNAALNGNQLKNTQFTNAAFDTSRYTDYLTLNVTGPADTLAFDNDYSGDAREINKADKEYQENKDASSSGGEVNNPAAGGGAPSGC